MTFKIESLIRRFFPILMLALLLSGCKKDNDDDDDNGSQVSCETTVTDIDGNIYGVVGIGSQCWMEQNLRTSRYKDGEVIAHFPDNNNWQSTSIGAWSYYGNNEDNGIIYGKLYNGHAVNTGKLCPDGWRVPSLEDYQELSNTVGANANALKSIPFWDPQDGETNSSGFSALPGGFRQDAGEFFDIRELSSFYSSTLVDQTNSVLSMAASDSIINLNNQLNMNYGLSCRCIKGEEEDTSGFNCVSGSCTEVDSDATYATLADCQSECASTAGYNCQGGNCVAVNQNATYVSLSACISNCSGSNAGYNCNGGSCVSVSSNATYADLASCQSACAQDCNIQVAIVTQTSSSATAEASGGNPPYNYIWSNGDTGPTATNLSPGSTYTVIASEVSNSECMDMIQVTIEGSSGGDCCDCTGIGFACDVCCDGEFDMIGLSWAEWEAIFADSGCDCE